MTTTNECRNRNALLVGIILGLLWRHREAVVHSLVYGVVWLMYRRENGGEVTW